MPKTVPGHFLYEEVLTGVGTVRYYSLQSSVPVRGRYYIEKKNVKKYFITVMSLVEAKINQVHQKCASHYFVMQ